MHLLSKYDWITLYNQAKVYYQGMQQKALYKKRKIVSGSKIERIDGQEAIQISSEIYLFAIMRNESLRLPHFIDYYKQLNIDRFFIIDNNSTDNSVDIALSHDNVYVFKTNESYQNHWYWMEHLLDKYGKGHWCVVVDIDELLYFPHVETLSIRHICQFIEESGKTALRALLLDMYSDQSVKNTAYVAGQNPLDSVPYFDTDHYEVTFTYFDRSRWEPFNSTHFTGGMRERIFGKTQHVTSLNKFPLFKNVPGTYLGQGMHAINGAKISDLQGVAFHTKFLYDFIQEAEEESIRGQHFNNASAYKDFNRRLNQNPDLCLATPDSVRFRDSAQLVELGLMKTNAQFEEFAQKQVQKQAIDAL